MKVGQTISQQVREFHEMTHQPVRDTPTVPPDDEVRTRLRLVLEECFELVGACIGSDESIRESWRLMLRAINTNEVKVDMVEAADALADIAYVVEGTNLSFGIDSATVLAEVQRSNMSKRGGYLDEHGKFRKPPDWSAPRIDEVLARLTELHAARVA